MNKKFLTGMVTGVIGTVVVSLLVIGIYLLKNRFDSKAEELKQDNISIVQSIEDSTEDKEEKKEETTSDGESSDSSKALTASDFENKLNYILRKIDKEYYLDVDDSVLYEGMLNGLMESLDDPYSAYYNASEFNSMMEKTEGDYYGIGAYVSQDLTTKEIFIASPIEGSPAEEVGMKTGDMLIAVDGEDIRYGNLDEIVSRIKGPEGTTVDVTVIRDEQEIVFHITRRKIEIKSVAYEMLEGDIGYIRMLEFNDTATKQYIAAVDDLEAQGAKALVIDLRSNPGGTFDGAVDCLDRMLEKDKLLVYLEYKDGTQERTYSEDKKSYDRPVAILSDRYSASSSEIFMAAMQYYGNAIIVGEQSFGKGIVQILYPIYTDLSGIKLTVARYFTPEGVCIHGIGVTPDVPVEYDDSITVTKLEEDYVINAAIGELRKKLK